MTHWFTLPRTEDSIAHVKNQAVQ